MLKDLGRRLGAGVVAAMMIAVAAGITLVALSFAAYAGLKMVVSPASASALTALIFALVVGLIAVVAPKVIVGKPKPAASHSETNALARIDPAVLRTAGEVGAVVLGVIADLALSHRLRRQQKAREAKHRKRR